MVDAGKNVDRDGLRIIEAQPIALEGLDALPGRQERLQIESDDVVRQDARIRVTAAQRRGIASGIAFPRKVRAVGQGLKDGGERPVSRTLHQRQHLRRRPSVDIGEMMTQMGRGREVRAAMSSAAVALSGRASLRPCALTGQELVMLACPLWITKPIAFAVTGTSE
jgi:hypothetical protein